MQDALCTVSTGGGYATRKFYTNGEEHVLETKRPVMLNGIGGIATRPDLIERTVRADAPQISREARSGDTDLEQAWEKDHPKAFGALLELFAAALKVLPEVQLKERQRMADFERLGEAIVRVWGEPEGSFTALYAQAQREGTERALESYGVATALAMLVEELSTGSRKSWTGTVGMLFKELNRTAADHSNWPQSPKGLGDQLRRLAPALRGQGLEVKFGNKVQSGRQVTVTWAQPTGATISPPAADSSDLASGVPVHVPAAPA